MTKPTDKMAKARDIRTKRAARLRALKSGELPAVRLFDRCPPELQGATVAQVLGAVPKLRDLEVRVLCTTFGVWPLDPWGTVLDNSHARDQVRQRLLEHGVL